MFPIPRYLLILVMVASWPLAQTNADDRALAGAQLATVQEATRHLASEVDYLQDLIVELRGEKERALYVQADAVLADIEEFERSVKPGIARERLERAFETLDGELHKFLETVQDLSPEHRVLRRAAARVSAADDQIHFALFVPGGSVEKANQILKRQARTLVMAARQLDHTAQYALGAVPGKAILLSDLHKLVEAAEQFERKLTTEADRQKLRNDFAELNQAWERATRGIGDLKIRENAHLLRSAGQLDRAHERLYRLLGVEGERPHLIIRT